MGKPIKPIVKSYNIVQNLTVESQLLPIPGLSVYRCMLSGAMETVDEPTWEGICYTTDLPTPRNQRPEVAPKDRWCVLSNTIITEIARWGWNGEERDYAPWLKRHSLWEFASKYPNLFSGQDSTLMRPCHDSFMLFSPEGPLPVAKYVEYTEGMGNLNKAHQHLSAHPHVKDLSAVQPIPSYDCESYDRGESHRESFEFLWCPDVDTYRKAWEWCLVNDNKYPSTRFVSAIFALDLLGLRACGT